MINVQQTETPAENNNNAKKNYYFALISQHCTYWSETNTAERSSQNTV